MKVEENTTGRFPGVSSDEYHNELMWAFSKGDLDAVDLSPSNLIQKRHSETDSDALRFGRAMHTRLEFHNNDEKFQELIAMAPKVDGRTSVGKSLMARHERNAIGKIHLDYKEAALLEKMFASLRTHPDADSFLEAEGFCEETFVWQDKESGVFCKCRPDKYLTEAPTGLPDHIVIDWKTIDSCDKRNIQKAIYERRYHVQSAMMIDGLEAVLGHSVGPFVNVFIEKNRPNRVLCVVIPDSDIEIGRKIYKANLKTIAECIKTKLWPGFVDIGLPPWAA